MYFLCKRAKLRAMRFTGLTEAEAAKQNKGIQNSAGVRQRTRRREQKGGNQKGWRQTRPVPMRIPGA